MPERPDDGERSEAGIVGLGTASETQSKLEKLRRSPQGTPKNPSRRRRVIGRGLLRHAVSNEDERKRSQSGRFLDGDMLPFCERYRSDESEQSEAGIVSLGTASKTKEKQHVYVSLYAGVLHFFIHGRRQNGKIRTMLV